MSTRFRSLKALSLLFMRFSWRRKGLWLRAMLCWMIGMVFILADREHDYDTRLQLRGEQAVDSQIVTVNINPENWQIWLASNTNKIKYTNDPSVIISDRYYWEPKAWQRLLGLILSEKPAVIGVIPYFGENISRPSKEILRSQALSDSRIVWTMQLDDDGRIMPSRFAQANSHNTGLNDLIPDRDGVIRRVSLHSGKAHNFAAQIARKIPTLSSEYLENSISEKSHVINYGGPKMSFTQLNLNEITSRNLPSNFFYNKIVLIGTSNNEEIEYRTPLGNMSRTEIVANLIDNIKNEKWVNRPNLALIALQLLLVVFIAAWVTSSYPQFLALFIIFCSNLFYSTLSLWIFDAFHFWTPIFVVVLVTIVTYVTFLSFQLTLKEYLNIQLENEKQFLFEVEQLKNNFLSLISHDLKTPIAKIQAICDRLIAQHPNQELTHDLSSLREVSSELHRYIQTILQITKVESRNFSLNKDSADINEIIDIVIGQLEPLANFKKIHLSTALDPIFLIEVDQVLMREVILNIVENAIKYTPEGGAIKITSREVDDQVYVMVEDTGPGIPPEEQTQIFEKFFRGELGKSQPKGSGLGLYLVKYFVELHNGKVFLESSTKGTKVGFSLPIGDVTIEPEYKLNSQLGDKKYAALA
ncbi:MAG: hypothetical protein A2Z20_00635 [Bdellovibrionales bacterium RBG_16_40_8]|nr:MAG: hypothetical protein A2Z20_00635 [Bdellovibrionales bacterium RBG_16_40_8]